MSAWPGKYVIGLTGNIATGKSEVRRMLEKLGAFGIDADALAHLVIQKGEPAYLEILDAFGPSILLPDGQIDRLRLGQIVFTDRAMLARLEAIVHPRVRQQVDALVRQTAQPVVVIEAIKLIESGYPQVCDTIWVTYSPSPVQLDRLVQQRGMDAGLASQRIAAQPAQSEKLAAADVIIHNDGTLEEVWRQVVMNWEEIVQ